MYSNSNLIQSLKVATKAFAAISETDESVRLCRLVAKNGAIGNRGVNESQGVIVPRLLINEIQAVLSNEVGKEFIRNAIESVQDSIVRKLFADGQNNVYVDSIGVERILAAMATANESSGNRFSKESIKVWFVADMEILLDQAIRNKQANISQDKLDKLIAGYLADFQLLAGRGTITLSSATRNKLAKAIALLPDEYESEFAGTAQKVLEKFSESTVCDVEDAL